MIKSGFILFDYFIPDPMPDRLADPGLKEDPKVKLGIGKAEGIQSKTKIKISLNYSSQKNVFYRNDSH